MDGGGTGEGSAMSDMATGLGATASCPSCGAQVDVTQVGGADVVRCPKCGEAVPAGTRDEVSSDVTTLELVRAFGIEGYDAEATVADDGTVVCGACGVATAPGDWNVDDLRHGSSVAGGDPASAEGAVAAVRCPRCAAAGVLVLDAGLDDPAAPGAGVLEALEGRRRG
jgi:predicted RNA-binding Zn-ribbon protein involved in translation (DUF1610 family)